MRSLELPRPARTSGHPTPLAVARWCAEQGWPVHPLAPGRKTPTANCPACRTRTHIPQNCPCIPEGRPCHGFHAATTDTRLIDTWWNDTPAAGIGVACGPADLVVIDIDAHPAEVPDRSRLLPGIPIHESVDLAGLASGFDTLALLAAYRGRPNPAEDTGTLRVRTPSGGLHVWYRNPTPATRYRCSTGSSTKTALAWQVDVRADGGYIVAPTTRTTGGRYEAQGPTRLPAPLPTWLQDELARTGHLTQPAPSPTPTPAPPPRSHRRRTAGARRLLEPLLNDIAQCAAALQGMSFTEKLNRAAYTAGGLVGAGHLDHATIRAELQQTADQARPGTSRRSTQIIDDALAAGARRPLHPEGRS
ncbi:bifunctional DNA primase/polymerase [Streptomyces sp. NPDC058855]|uniref:bifunctional DNA primase/polymerase n=1 Tax=Streptomyces sp. NPDC058855 TaxID=3346651 RepID=UPI0036A4AA5B